MKTYGRLELGPADSASRLELGLVVSQDSLLQDVCLVLAEIPNPDKRDRVGGRQGEETDEGDSHENGEDTLDLV